MKVVPCYALNFDYRAVQIKKIGPNHCNEEAAGNVRTEEMITGVDDEGEIRTEERKEICDGTPLMATHAYTKNQESPVGKEIDLRQWDTLIFKGQVPTTRGERTLEPSRRQKRRSRIRTSRVPGGHPRHDTYSVFRQPPCPTSLNIVLYPSHWQPPLTGKRRYREGSRKQYRGKPDWTGGRTKEELFSGSDRWHQEKHYDLRWRLYHPENRFNTEQGGGRSRVFTGSKNRACDRESIPY